MKTRKESDYIQAIRSQKPLPQQKMITELPVGKSRLDVLLVGEGTGIVYEIKSERDTLRRLKTQLQDYQKVFSLINIVTHTEKEKALFQILESYPAVGVQILDDNGALHCQKEAVHNDSFLNLESINQIFRKDERNKVLLKYFGQLPQVSDFQYYRTCLEWMKQLDVKTVQEELLLALEKRK